MRSTSFCAKRANHPPRKGKACAEFGLVPGRWGLSMFYVSKIVWAFLQPSSLIVILFAAGAFFAIAGKSGPL